MDKRSQLNTLWTNPLNKSKSSHYRQTISIKFIIDKPPQLNTLETNPLN